MTTIIRCPDFPLTSALRTHLGHRFAHAFKHYRDRISLVEVSVRSLHKDARHGDDVHVHAKVELGGMESIVITAVSHDAYIALSIAARRARRAVKRAIRRHERIEHRGLRLLAYNPARLAHDNG
jgi:ribosome-associated translation inhibitor RaiA